MLRLSGGFKLTLLELFFVSCFDNTGMPNAVVAVPSIVLCTLNAKYIHASLGLRYLLANMGELRASTVPPRSSMSPRLGMMGTMEMRLSSALVR